MARLLMLTSEFPPFRGGIATYTYELATAAAADGHEVVVVAPDYHANQSNADGEEPFRVIRYRDGPASMRGLPRRILVTWRVMRRESFDIVHAIDWPFFIPLRLVRSHRPLRRLLTLHGTEILYMRQARRRMILDALRFWHPGWAEWIGNSRYTVELALAHFPLDGATARAIPLAVSAEWTCDRTSREEARRVLGTGDRFVIVSLGRVVPRKGHGYLADALALMPAAYAGRITWWIIGPEQEPDFTALLRDKVRNLPIEVLFLGKLPTDEVKLRLSAADLFCLPGYQDSDGRVEGFGLAFLEAAAFGLPAIATRSGGIPEAVDDGVTGLLVSERDPIALAEAICFLAEDDERRSTMAAAAESRAASSTWHSVMLKTYGFPAERQIR